MSQSLNDYLQSKFPLLRSFSGRRQGDGKRDWPEWWEELPDAPRTGVLPVELSVEAFRQWARWELENLADPIYSLPRDQGGVWFSFEGWLDLWAKAAQVFARRIAEQQNRGVWRVPGAHGYPDPVARARAVVESFSAWLEPEKARGTEKKKPSGFVERLTEEQKQLICSKICDPGRLTADCYERALFATDKTLSERLMALWEAEPRMLALDSAELSLLLFRTPNKAGSVRKTKAWKTERVRLVRERASSLLDSQGRSYRELAEGEQRWERE